jgi:cytochrome c oxidase subunit 2
MMSWLPRTSPRTARIDDLFYLYYITGAAFVLVTVLLVAFLCLAARGRAGGRSTATASDPRDGVDDRALADLIVLTFLAIPSWSKIKPVPEWTSTSGSRRSSSTGRSPTRADGKFDTADDQTLDNEVHVPTGKPVVLHLRARDVIHSFFVPQLRFKQDAVPGHEIPQWFKVTQVGKYEIPCAELCGFGHSGMKGYLFVHTPEEYQQWVKEKWPS